MITANDVLLEIYRLQQAGKTPYHSVIQNNLGCPNLEREFRELLDSAEIQRRDRKFGKKWVAAYFIDREEVKERCKELLK